MAKTSELEILNVGIVGHIDHGKTTLLHKLSGKWTDTHSEELKRGITLKLGYADIIIYKDKNGYNKENGTPVRHVSFVDSPGHEMLMATMLSGAAIIDVAILVIAANEGIKPQTREHLMALQAKKVEKIIVVQNKIDLVDSQTARKNYAEIKALLKDKYSNALIIPVSAQQGINLDEVYKAIAEIPINKRKEEGNPIFIIARSFDINKPGSSVEELHGAVIGGTLKQGILRKGEEIEIMPGRVIKEANQYHYKPLKSRIIGLYKGSKKLDELTPGGSMSIETELDMSLGKSDALSGCIASKVGTMPEMTKELKIKYFLFPEIFEAKGVLKIEKIKASETLMISVNTSMSIGIAKRVDEKEIELSLKIPLVPYKGDNVGIARNLNGHWRLIGYGEII
ncbi:MAG: translation initiation factor IF-2 subunit gamma [Nanoarchaeota archaeon]